MEKIRFVIATRESRHDFFTKTATGKSLAIYKFPFVEFLIFPNNREGLSTVYNRAIEQAINNPAILVFAHDDLHFLDYYWVDQFYGSLQQFDIVGVAGNKRRIANQPGWIFIDKNFTKEKSENMSGLVGHGKSFPPSNLSVYGNPRQEVKLLDGLLLIARSQTLINNQIKFDEQFEFHFYDMDFCRQAESKHIRMGTWTISLIHESVGSFGSPSWSEAYAKYLKKWKS